MPFTKALKYTRTRLLMMLLISATVLSTLLLLGATSSNLPAELISIGVDGQAGSSGSAYAGSEIRAGAVSADGRYVVFSSLASNMTADSVSGWHVYLRDRSLNTTTLLTGTGGDPSIGSTSEGSAVISADGRYVAFQSTNGQLVAGDTNGSADIFVYDRTNATRKRVSVASDGSQASPCSCGWPDTCNGCEYHWLNSHPSISGDGRYITFTSFSFNFVDGDLADTPDVFVHDQQTGSTSIISRASDGNLGNANSGESCISSDGNSISFSSLANNLVVNDWNNHQDVFVWRRDTANLSRVSVASDGSEGNSASTDPVISADGNLVAFASGATTLAGPDSNGFVYDIFLHDRSQGKTSILSSGLPSGGGRPAITDNGMYVSFTSGSDDIYLLKLADAQRQLADNSMQFSALNNDGSALVVSGYGSLVALDSNSDKDVYLVSIDVEQPLPDAEPLPDEEQPADDSTAATGDDSSNDNILGSSCAYHPDGRFDPVLPGLVLLMLSLLGWRLRNQGK